MHRLRVRDGSGGVGGGGGGGSECWGRRGCPHFTQQVMVKVKTHTQVRGGGWVALGGPAETLSTADAAVPPRVGRSSSSSMHRRWHRQQWHGATESKSHTLRHPYTAAPPTFVLPFP